MCAKTTFPWVKLKQTHNIEIDGFTIIKVPDTWKNYKYLRICEGNDIEHS